MRQSGGRQVEALRDSIEIGLQSFKATEEIDEQIATAIADEGALGPDEPLTTFPKLVSKWSHEEFLEGEAVARPQIFVEGDEPVPGVSDEGELKVAGELFLGQITTRHVLTRFQVRESRWTHFRTGVRTK